MDKIPIIGRMPISQFMLSKHSYLAKATCGALFMTLTCASHASAPSEATNIVMAASKQLNMLPGLWEITMKMQGTAVGTDAAKMWPQLMDKMQPEQLKYMQSKLAELNITVDGNELKMLFCASPETTKNQTPVHFSNNCVQKIDTLVDGKLQFSSVCTSPDIRIEGHATNQGSTGYLMRANITQNYQGRPETMTFASSSKYLRTDCGAVKPTQVKPKE